MIIDEVNDELEEKIVMSMAKDPQYMGGEFEWRMSKSGDCPRKMDYEIAQGRVPIGANSALRMERGTFLHSMWHQLMINALGDDFIDAEGEVIYVIPDGDGPGVAVPGHYDGIVVSLDAIYELKNVSEYSFKMVQKSGPFAANVEQANFYAGNKGLSQILMHYFDTSSCESLRFLIPFDKAMFEGTKLKWFNRLQNKRAKTLAERPYNDATQSPCWFCDFKDQCYEGFKQSVKEYEGKIIQIVDDGYIYGQSSYWLQNRVIRLQSEKQEVLHKENLIKEMHDMKINKLRLDNGDRKLVELTLSVGKNDNSLLAIKEFKSANTGKKQG